MLKFSFWISLANLGRTFSAFAVRNDPRSWVFGLVRSIIALSTLLTLLFNSTSNVFREGVGFKSTVECDGVASLSPYCLVAPAHMDLVWLFSIVVLLLVLSGLYPRLTAPLHWWVTFGYNVSARAVDGGDQAASNLTLLIMLIALGDPRRSHWGRVDSLKQAGLGTVSSAIVWQFARLQVAVIYFNACIEKFKVSEWVDGTATYYFINSPYMGAPDYLKPFLSSLVASPAVVLFTWSTLALEFALGLSILLPGVYQRILLYLGLLFHLAILVLLGISSFSVVMMGALVLMLVNPALPLAKPLDWLNVLRERLANLGTRREPAVALRQVFSEETP